MKVEVEQLELSTIVARSNKVDEELQKGKSDKRLTKSVR
jgi:hypothetical protein